MFRSVSFRFILMDLNPPIVCIHVCVLPRAWGDSYSSTVAHHCPWPFSWSSSPVMASSTSASSQTAAPQLAPLQSWHQAYLLDTLMGPLQEILIHTHNNNYTFKSFKELGANHMESIQSCQTITINVSLKWIHLCWVTDFAPSATGGHSCRQKRHMILKAHS